MRPGYEALPRPHDRLRQSPMPKVPPVLPEEAGGLLARMAMRLNLTVAEADERLSVEDLLDERDATAYLHDVDHEPAEPPPSSGRGR